MYRTIESHPHHLPDAASVIAVGLVDLRLQHDRMSRIATQITSGRLEKRTCRTGSDGPNPGATLLRLEHGLDRPVTAGLVEDGLASTRQENGPRRRQYA